MTHRFKLAWRAARLRAPFVALLALGFAACDSAEQLTDTTSEEPAAPSALEPAVDAGGPSVGTLTVADTLGATDPSDPTGGVPIYDGDDDGGLVEEEDDGIDAAASAAPVALASSSSFRGGMPFGLTQTPKEQYGKFSGALSNPGPRNLLAYLAAARRTGTRVMLVFSGNERHFKNGKSFSLEKWKARVNRYRGINFSSYIKDGTIIGHRLIDEPHDPSNWGGRAVSRVEVEAMAKYSKFLWPTMPTIARAWPAYLRGYNYRYLDAGWAQYLDRLGNVSTFLNNNVRDSKSAGLALVVGLNQLTGGARQGGIRGFIRDKYAMSGSQLKAWGSVLLSDQYACAFLNWMYHPRYMSRPDVKAALSYLAGKARGRSTKSCRGS
jgi:hypothetical protein